MFLTCTVGYVPNIVHSGSVFIFGTSFLIHSGMVCRYIQPNVTTKITLGIGILAFISLIFVKNMWFWAMECVGLSSMWLFTPIDWILLSRIKKTQNLISDGSIETTRNRLLSS